MLLVFLLLQFVPAPTRDAVVSRYLDRHTWAVVRTELDPQWQVASFHPEARPVSISLSWTSSPSESEWRSVIHDASRPAAPSGAAMLQSSLADDLPSGKSIASSAPMVSSLTNYSPSTPAIELASVTDSPVIVPWMLGDLSHTMAASSVLATGSGSSEGPGGGTGGPGGGIGGAIPEPTATIPLIAMVIPLILRRRPMRQNPAN